MSTTYQTEWAHALIKTALSDACHDAWRLVHQQPAGWARSGMVSRLDGVMKGSLEQHMRVACKEAPYHPPELEGNARALSAFDRLAGRRPSGVTVLGLDCMQSPIDGSWSLRATVQFEWADSTNYEIEELGTVERCELLRVQAEVTIKKEILEEMRAEPTV